MNLIEQLMERVARLEQQLTVLERDRADIDYIAMRTGVDIQPEERSEDNEQNV